MTTLSRRNFARFLALSGSAALFPGRAFAGTSLDELGLSLEPLPRTPLEPDEAFWREVRSRFLVPREVGFFNAANLCPMSLPVVETIEKNIRAYEVNPSPEARSRLMQGREDARKLLADALRVTPEEIVLTRNTTEGNNFVSSGSRGPGRRSRRLDGQTIEQPRRLASEGNAIRLHGGRGHAAASHPGATATRAVHQGIHAADEGPRRDLVSSQLGDMLTVSRPVPRCARARCPLARRWRAGVRRDRRQPRPDAPRLLQPARLHKVPCGPKEKGCSTQSRRARSLSPSIVGVYGGASDLPHLRGGRPARDDANDRAVVEALKFQARSVATFIEKRARALAGRIMSELRKLDGVHLWTDPAPDARRDRHLQAGRADPRSSRRAHRERAMVVRCAAERGESRAAAWRRTSTTRWRMSIASLPQSGNT